MKNRHLIIDFSIQQPAGFFTINTTPLLKEEWNMHRFACITQINHPLPIKRSGARA